MEDSCLILSMSQAGKVQVGKVPVGKVRVGKYDFKTKKCPQIPGFTNILIHVREPLSPYVLTSKSPTGTDMIMENQWQFAKLYPVVSRQNQTIHKFTADKGWTWPEQKHAYRNTQGELIVLPEYWKWRQTGMEAKFAVRYPNGFYGRKSCLCALWPNPHITGKKGIDYIEDPDGHKYEILDYVAARRKIYIPLYRSMIENHPYLANLRQRYQAGENLQIVEVDGPQFDPSGKNWPYSLAKDNSLEITPEVVKGLLENTSQNFGHGYCCAISILESFL